MMSRNVTHVTECDMCIKKRNTTSIALIKYIIKFKKILLWHYQMQKEKGDSANA